jgi:hypothetical protein
MRPLNITARACWNRIRSFDRIPLEARSTHVEGTVFTCDFANLFFSAYITVMSDRHIVALLSTACQKTDGRVCVHVNKVHHILDFKRSDKLAGDMHNKFRGKMESPFTHLDDCRGASYCFQLSIYQYILERDYGFSIGDRILLSIHPDMPFMTSVPYLYAETDFIMRKQFALVQGRRAAMELNPTMFQCSLTNAPVVDAVRLQDGSIVMEKAAIVRDLDYTPAMDIRVAFDAKVKENMPQVEPATAADCILWKRRVPQEGCQPFV